jgi:hypothetical protein
MHDNPRVEATSDFPPFENAIIGDGTLVEPDVMVGFRYHSDCGPARVGKHGILRNGTIIYGDVTIGAYFPHIWFVISCNFRSVCRITDRVERLPTAGFAHGSVFGNGPD